MQNLSKRLSLVASFVRTGSFVCDVGTDHGYLPVFLLKSKKVRGVCATEINKKPFENAKKTFREENADIDIFLCDGLGNESLKKADTVIIAGMGGEVISGIIDRAPFLKSGDKSLILQPMTAAGELRSYLIENGFYTEKEQAVCDGGKVYGVMAVRYDGTKRTADALCRRIGIIKPDSEDNIVYIKRQERLCAELCESIKNIPEREEFFKAESLALKQIRELLKEK